MIKNTVPDYYIRKSTKNTSPYHARLTTSNRCIRICVQASGEAILRENKLTNLTMDGRTYELIREGNTLIVTFDKGTKIFTVSSTTKMFFSIQDKSIMADLTRSSYGLTIKDASRKHIVFVIDKIHSL